VLVHAFSLVGGAEVRLQLFTASTLDKGVFKFTVRQLYKHRLNPRHALNRRPGAPQNRDARFGWKKNFVPPPLPKKIEPLTFSCPNQYLVTTLKDPSRFQQVK